ncbi:cupin domain-containing protein [Microbacterium sp. X-17]|uniref:(R)-mandelonitrile lyase n=1 Tax=Microbacterium sp. X-17 TaxID=3144404 RepID=UPI0031F4BFAD
MRVVTSSRPTHVGGPEWFTGYVYWDDIDAFPPGSGMEMVNVHFAPGSRSTWHSHPNGQVIHVTEGVGLCQREGGPVVEIRPGESVFFEPGENHWHGAAPDRIMVHLAFRTADEDGRMYTLGPHVTDEEYLAPAVRPDEV